MDVVATVKYNAVNETHAKPGAKTSRTHVSSMNNGLVAIVFSTYMVIAIYSVVFSYRRLNRPGVSKEVRTLFFKKHFCYVAVFILFWTI